MTTMAMAFNKAGVFTTALRAGVVEAARREMEAEMAARRRRAVRRLVEAGHRATVLNQADLEYAVRVLGARRTSRRRGDKLVLPSMPGWALAGRRG